MDRFGFKRHTFDFAGFFQAAFIERVKKVVRPCVHADVSLMGRNNAAINNIPAGKKKLLIFSTALRVRKTHVK